MTASVEPLAAGQGVGVVIRTLNESDHIARCLEALASQQPPVDLDVLVVDSGSTDGTVEIARAHGARIVEIAPADFDYSKALNLGIAEVRGELVLLLSAHTIPLDENWVATMTAPFADSQVAGVCSRQVPWPDANFREVHRLADQFGDEPIVYEGADAAPTLFSNAASCIHRSVWEAEPFTLPAAEDLEWAQRVVAHGWKVVYEARTSVYHSHNESARAQALRLIDLTRAAAGAAPRSRHATVREATAYVYRGAKAIAALDQPVRRKLAHLAEQLQIAWYYVADFSRAGSTAERRRSAT